LTRTTGCDAVLCEAEGDTPEVVREIDVVMLEAELTVRRVRSNTGTPEGRSGRTEGSRVQLGLVHGRTTDVYLLSRERVEFAGLISEDLVLDLVSSRT
jgi:hypothetical protein